MTKNEIENAAEIESLTVHLGYERIPMSVTPKEIGEYSMYVEEDLTNVDIIRVYLSKENSVRGVESINILGSPTGSVIYFSYKITDYFKIGKEYFAYAFREQIFNWDSLNHQVFESNDSLFKKMGINIEK